MPGQPMMQVQFFMGAGLLGGCGREHLGDFQHKGSLSFTPGATQSKPMASYGQYPPYAQFSCKNWGYPIYILSPG